MNGTLELLTIAFMTSPVVLVALIAVVAACVSLARQGENSSLSAQRRHDAEYAPVRDVYVVYQTTYNVENHTHNDNRSITIDANAMPLVADTQRALQAKPARKFKVVGEY